MLNVPERLTLKTAQALLNDLDFGYCRATVYPARRGFQVIWHGPDSTDHYHELAYQCNEAGYRCRFIYPAGFCYLSAKPRTAAGQQATPLSA